MIPKIIHQTCPDPDKLDPRTLENIAFLKANNPGWEHRLYSDADVRAYLKTHLAHDDLRTLERLNPKYNVVTADLMRYLLIYEEGGVYLDIKSTARNPLDSVLQPDNHFVLSQWPNRLGQMAQGAGLHPELIRVPGGEFQQWHVIACPRHPFLKCVIQAALLNCAQYNPGWFGVGKMGVLRLTGPICYTQAIAPVLSLHPHSIGDALAMGLVYSIFSTIRNPRPQELDPGHYSRQIEPIFFRA
jgi:mannosyltransferase OCH1-like enzyme